MTFLERIALAMADHKTRYAIVGGYAVALHGAVRGTLDVDIAIDWNLANLKRATTALESLGLVSFLPLTADDVYRYRDEYIRNRNLLAWHFHNPDAGEEQVDLVINYDLKGRKTRKFPLAKCDVTVLSLDDLVRMKKASGRDQDLYDIEALKKLK